MRYLLTISFLIAMTSTGIAAPSYQDVKAAYLRSDALLFDRHGEVIHELRVDPNARKLGWTRLIDISPALVKAVVRSAAGKTSPP